MKIIYSKEGNLYYDIHGKQIHEGDIIFLEGRKQKVYLTEEGYLGIDATNPFWIKSGRAVPCEYGIYPLLRADEPEIVETEEFSNEEKPN